MEQSRTMMEETWYADLTQTVFLCLEACREAHCGSHPSTVLVDLLLFYHGCSDNKRTVARGSESVEDRSSPGDLVYY